MVSLLNRWSLVAILSVVMGCTSTPPEVAPPIDAGPAPVVDPDADNDGVRASLDCDDGDPAIRPGRDEVVYNGVDDDCDPTSFDDDLDRDGSVVAIDCDDREALASPGRTEICGDHIDNDCSGDSNGCRHGGDISLPLHGEKLIGEAAHDEAGADASLTGDVNGDGYDDLLIGGPYNDRGGFDYGAVYLFYGGPGDAPIAGPASLATADAIFVGRGYEAEAGIGVALVDDLNGDEYADIVIGAENEPVVGTNPYGAVHIIYGRGDYARLAGSYSLADADATIVSDDYQSNFGHSVADAGDVDGDGFSDLLVGAFWYDGNGSYSGAAFLFYGGAGDELIAGELTVADAGAVLLGEDADDWAGNTLAGAGDVDADGFDDILVGASRSDGAVGGEGRVYLLHGGDGEDRIEGIMDLADADAIFVGEGPADALGRSVGAAGDVNRDGYDDILLGAPVHDAGGGAEGSAYLFLGGAGVQALTGVYSAAAADWILRATGGDQLGVSVGSCDLDGDGNRDIVVGCHTYQGMGAGSSAGGALVFHGDGSRFIGEHDLGDADAIFFGTVHAAYVGRRLSCDGDLNGDGHDDLVLGARGDDQVGDVSGAAYVIYGAGQ